MQQGLEYATTLDIPFVFSSNGDAFLFHDRTGASATPEATLALDDTIGKRLPFACANSRVIVVCTLLSLPR